jgi:hypothetical protein
MLTTTAAHALGYPKGSLLNRQMGRAYSLYGQHGGAAAQGWLKQYAAGSKKLLGHVAREPVGVQTAIHHHILHKLVSENPGLATSKPKHLNGFAKTMQGLHNGLAKRYGMPTLGAPPKVSPLAKVSLQAPGQGQPQRPTAGVNTQGVPRGVANEALRGALGMNPLPPAMRHPQPLSMAPGPAQMPGAKAMANPTGTPASEGGLT